MELIKHIDAVINVFVNQNCLFSDIDKDTFAYRVKAIDQKIDDDYIENIYQTVISNQTFDKRHVRLIPVNSSIKIIGMTKKFSVVATNTQKIELICFLVFLSEKCITFNKQINDIIKVIASILLTREEDYNVIQSLMANNPYPIVSDRSFVYILKGDIPLDILLTGSCIFNSANDDLDLYVYKLYSFESLYLIRYSSKISDAAGLNKTHVCNPEHLEIIVKNNFRFGFFEKYDTDKYKINDCVTYNGNDSLPSLKLDRERGVLFISGVSMPLNAFEFYQPVLKWMNNFKTEYFGNFELHIDLNFFDTQSSKMLLEIMRKVMELKECGVIVKFYWYFSDDDYDLKEAGMDYSSIVSHDFHFVEKINCKISRQ